MAGGGVSIDLGHTVQMLSASYAHIGLHQKMLGEAEDGFIRVMEHKSELVLSICH